MTARRRILFVDDEQMILRGLRNGLRKHHERWDMAFAASGADALTELASAPVDVIVSDMRMPQMDGLTLLETVRQQFPCTARIILTGYAEPDAIVRIFGVAHQLLGKPCPLFALAAAIDRACRLRDVLGDPATCAVVARLPELPPPPALYFDIALALAYPEIPIEDIAARIDREPGLRSRILELCTPAFGFDRVFARVGDAVIGLGPAVIGPLVLASHAWATFGPVASVSFDDIKHHGFAIARRVATSTDRGHASDAFAAGLLHDLGKLVLARYCPVEYGEVIARTRATGEPSHVAEAELLGTTHAALAAHVLARWGVALPIIDAVAHHADPTDSSLAGAIASAHHAVPQRQVPHVQH